MPCILLVDDEPDILDTLADLVAMRFPDAEVRKAPDGPSGLELAEGVDLIVSDYRMPGMDGLTCLGHVQERHPGTPAILLTAYNERERAVQAAQRGILRSFFLKPPDVDALLAGMAELLDPDQLV